MISIVKTDTNTSYEFMNGNYKVLYKIPDNATNGDVLKMLFPQSAYETSNGEFEYIWFSVNEYVNLWKIQKEWWNAPYKSESE